MATGEIPSYLHSATPAAIRKRPRIHRFKLSEVGSERDRRNVYLRIKPKRDKGKTSFVALDETTLVPIANDFHQSRKGISQQYKFTKIFGCECNQEEIFKETCITPLNNFVHGANSLLCAYGATNAGKTHTIQGSIEQPGIIPRALNVLFNTIQSRIAKEIKVKPEKACSISWLTPDDVSRELELKRSIMTFNLDKHKFGKSVSSSSLSTDTSQSSTDSSVVCPCFEAMRMNLGDGTIELEEDPSSVYSVWVSYAEIYNENIYDLLLPTSKPQKPLLMGENSMKDVFIKGLTDVCVFSAEEAFKVFLYGQHNLHQAATSINHVSSRSHSIFFIKLVKHLNIYCPTLARLSVCTFVDLAGSERAKKTNNAGERMKESQCINTSLHVLGKCLEVLRCNQKTRERRMLPCRESKLTRLFQRALEGKDVLTMIVNINQDEQLFDETLNVLKFSAIAMELQYEKCQDSTICSLRQSSVFTFMEKVSTSLQSSLEGIEEVPEDTRYIKLLAYIEELKKNLEEEKRRNTTLEVQIRKETYSHFQKIITDMENTYRERLNAEKEVFAEYEEINSNMYKMYLNMGSKRFRENESEDSDNESEDCDDNDYEERIQFLENKVEALSGQVEVGKQLKAAHTALQTKFSKVQCELSFVKQELKNTRKLNEMIGVGGDSNDLVIKELEEQLNKQHELLRERNSEIEVLNKLVEDAKAEYNEHFHEHEDFAARNVELEEMLADRELKIDDLQGQLDICNKKLIELQHQMGTKELEIVSYAQKLQEAFEARDEFKFKAAQAECELKKLKKENEELKKQPMTSNNNEEVKMGLLVASLEDKLKIYEKKLKIQEDANKELGEKIVLLKSQAVCSNQDSYEKEISLLQNEIKDHFKSKKELMDKIEQLSKEQDEKLRALQIAENALTQEQNNTKTMRRICESEKNRVVEQLQHNEERLRDQIKELEKLSADNDRLKLQNMELEEMVKVKEDEMETFKSRRNAQFECYENLLRQEREMREREQREVHQMHSVMRALTPKRNEHLAEIEKLKEQLMEAHLKVSELSKERKKNCMLDISNRSDDAGVSHKGRSRHRTRAHTKQNENTPVSDDDIKPVCRPEMLIKPDPDTNRQLRPRKKKVLYSSDDIEGDFCHPRSTRRH